jgi:hypothetical protein
MLEFIMVLSLLFCPGKEKLGLIALGELNVVSR